MAWPTRPDLTEGRRARRRRRRLVGLGTAALAVIVCCALLLAQANSTGGALAADVFRAVIGPAATARVEVTYLGLADTLRHARYHVGGQSVRAPWTVPATATPPSSRSTTATPRSGIVPPLTVSSPVATDAPTAAPTPLPRDAPTEVATGRTRATRRRGPRGRARSTPMRRPPVATLPLPLPPGPRAAPAPRVHRPLPMHLPPMSPIVTPALPGEGIWTTAGLPSPRPGPGALPPIAKAFIRPDAARPYALVTLLQVDLRVAQLHIVAGTAQPAEPRGLAGAGVIPGVNWSQDRLLAAFNGGFKYSDGAYAGLWPFARKETRHDMHLSFRCQRLLRSSPRQRRGSRCRLCLVPTACG